jgi:hypothetical protein
MPSLINSDDGVVSGTSGLKTTGGNDGILALQNNGTTNVTVTAAGNVGIGTSSPGTSNTEGVSFVPGTSSVTSITGSNGSGQLLLGNNNGGSNASANTSCGLIAFKARFNGTFGGGNDVASIIGTYTGNGTTRSGAIRFLTLDNGAEAERARITSAGTLLIGKTSDAATTRGTSFAGTGSATIVDSQTGDGPQIQVVNIWSSVASGYRFFSFRINAGATEVGSISTNGSSTTSYNTSSDYRLKENIQPMTGALAKVSLLKPCTYTWKTNGSAGQGFIAHELQEVCPDAVTGVKDAVDDQGNPKYQGVDTSFLVATLTAAIQEQQQMIETLQAEVAELKARV